MGPHRRHPRFSLDTVRDLVLHGKRLKRSGIGSVRSLITVKRDCAGSIELF